MQPACASLARGGQLARTNANLANDRTGPISPRHQYGISARARAISVPQPYRHLERAFAFVRSRVIIILANDPLCLSDSARLGWHCARPRTTDTVPRGAAPDHLRQPVHHFHFQFGGGWGRMLF